MKRIALCIVAVLIITAQSMAQSEKADTVYHEIMNIQLKEVIILLYKMKQKEIVDQ